MHPLRRPSRPTSLFSLSLSLSLSLAHTASRPSPHQKNAQAQPPDEFVEELKGRGIRVPGIGHRIKSKDNRDKRVELLQR